MNEKQTTTGTAGRNTTALFDHEKLDVYHLELKFIGWVTPLLEEVSQTAAVKTSEVRDQLDRASLSALLNTAEGNGKRQRQVRAKFFDDARRIEEKINYRSKGSRTRTRTRTRRI
jgi:hypothetical protein